MTRGGVDLMSFGVDAVEVVTQVHEVTLDDERLARHHRPRAIARHGRRGGLRGVGADRSVLADELRQLAEQGQWGALQIVAEVHEDALDVERGEDHGVALA